MKSVKDLLLVGDPLREEPHMSAAARDRLRRAIMTAASGAATASSSWLRVPVALLAAVALIVVGLVAVRSPTSFRGSTTLQAAVRFEVRLAEDHQMAGLREARVAGSDDLIYLHEEVICANDDIAQSSLISGDAPSRFGVSVQFNPAGAQKMRQATAGHVGRPLAILIDGDVVTAPVLRGPISTSAVLSGHYTRAEAERIVNGITLR